MRYQSMRTVWHVGIAFAGLGFVLTLFEKEIELRRKLNTRFGMEEKKKKEEEENGEKEGDKEEEEEEEEQGITVESKEVDKESSEESNKESNKESNSRAEA